MSWELGHVHRVGLSGVKPCPHVTPGSHKPLQDLFPRNSSQAELAYVVVPRVRMRQEQEAYLSRPPTGNSSNNKAITAYEAQFTAVSPVGDAMSPPFYRQGA